MISEKTDAASPSRLAGSLSIASNDVVKTKPAAITSFIFLPPLSHEVVATALPVHGSHHFRPLAATVQAKGKGSVLAPARRKRLALYPCDTEYSVLFRTFQLPFRAVWPPHGDNSAGWWRSSTHETLSTSPAVLGRGAMRRRLRTVWASQ